MDLEEMVAAVLLGLVPVVEGAVVVRAQHMEANIVGEESTIVTMKG